MGIELKNKNLNIDGKTFDVQYLKSGKDLWLHCNGETYLYKGDKISKKQSQVFESGPMRSPMPGKIVKVQVNEGDSIEAKKTILVLEAMKMEYSIKAPVNVEVKKIHCKAGDQVKEGDILVEVEKS